MTCSFRELSDLEEAAFMAVQLQVSQLRPIVAR